MSNYNASIDFIPIQQNKELVEFFSLVCLKTNKSGRLHDKSCKMHRTTPAMGSLLQYRTPSQTFSCEFHLFFQSDH